jgi:hypothetical protein
MRFQQSSAYPICGRYLGNFLTYDKLKLQHPLILQAFVACCANEDFAKKALTPNMDPLIYIGVITGHPNGAFYGRAGGATDTVYINEEVAKQYENDYGWLVWESTVLHEMVHWARFNGGLPGPLADGSEAGKAFEIQAYGSDIDRKRPPTG